MSTRTPFEERLLEELKREIRLREAGGAAGEGASAPVRRPEPWRLSPRRIAVAATACALAGLAVVFVPGTSADSTAYAVERVGDGTIKLTVKDQTISVAAQQELATKVSAWGIQVTVDVLPPGYVCERSNVPPIPGIDAQGNRVPIIPIKAGWDLTLRRGNVLAFENTRGDSRPRAVEFYTTEKEVEPCVPVKVTLPDN